MVRKMCTDDVHRVVQVHLASFPGFFLSFLGPRFLRIFYRGIRQDESGIGYVYLNPAGDPAGFVAGTINPQGFYKRLLKRNWLRFSLASLVPIARRPAVAGRIARALLHPGQNPVGDNVAGLFSIGVFPELQGTGAGKLLVRAFLDEAAARGCRSVFLTTDRDGNDAVNLFYQKLGFSIGRQYVTPEGRRMNEYWISIAPEGV